MPAMFTGIIEQVAALAAVRSAERGVRLDIDLGPLASDAKLGDSISVSGACLTIATLAGERATFDVSAETLRKTTLGGWRAGQPWSPRLWPCRWRRPPRRAPPRG